MLIFQGTLPSKLSPEQMQANMGKWMAWVDKLAKSEQYVSGEPLLPGGKIVSGKGGKSVTDAVAISKDCPDFEEGSIVQVRQVMKMDM